MKIDTPLIHDWTAPLVTFLTGAADVLLTHGWAVLAVVILIGLSVGSFLNVVVYRLPMMLTRLWHVETMTAMTIETPRLERFNLMLPRSHCPVCRTTIKARDNIPLLSWLLSRGSCRNCAARISPRYPLVEFAGAVLLVTTIAAWGYTWTAASYYVFQMALLALALIDFDTLLLPDQITLPLLWLGILFAIATELEPTLNGGPTVVEAAFGATAGYAVLWAFYWGHKLITGREGMGYGDFKLLAALGAWLGWQGLLPIILIASTTGLGYACVGLLRGTASRASPIPFGTFLCIGGGGTLYFISYWAPGP